MIAQNALNTQETALNTSLTRLSTGLQINSAKDNPSGLVAVLNFQSQQAGATQAISNAQQANNMISTAEGSLNQVSSLLTQLQTLVSASANSGSLSSTQVAANQAQVDSILSSINQIATGTTFDGKNLLNGSLGYVTSGVAGASITGLQVNQAQVAAGSPQAVAVSVTAAGTHGKLTYTGVASGGSDYVTGAATIQVTGSKGTSTNINITAAETLAQAQTAVNAQKATTGASATLSGAVMILSATGLGSSGFVSVQPVSGTFTTNVLSAHGTDATVTVNGQAANTAGLNVNYQGGTLDVGLTMSSSFASSVGNTTFYVTGGGANFMIGSNVSLSNTVGVGIGSVTTGSLGNTTDGYLASLGSGQANSLTGNLSQAQTILNDSINQVATLRGNLGAFQSYTLTPTVNTLQVALENNSSAQSAIQDTDFAAETSNLTRAQILSSSATSMLSLANSQPQNVLSLLKNL
jgi:flagellin